MAKSHLELATPTEANQTVARARRPGAELQTREHLTPDEVELLVAAAKANRHGHRDATMILVAFRHGLRAAEVCDLRWNQVEFDAAILHVRRVKNGTPSTHRLLGDEMRPGLSTSIGFRADSCIKSAGPNERMTPYNNN